MLSPSTMQQLLAPDEPRDGPRVLMVVMPWAPPRFPGLGPSLIRSILVRDEIPCDILYGNLVFSKLFDSDPLIERQLSKIPIIELAFTPHYFGTPAGEAARQLHDEIAPLAADPSMYPLEKFEKVVACAGQCLDSLMLTVESGRYDVVGFSVMMQQTVPSLALAKRLKAAQPGLRVVFGGANASRPMGDEMIRRFPEIDYLVEGEADAIVTPLVRAIRSGADVAAVGPGILFRDPDGQVRQTGESRPFSNLDSLPMPDYAPYFHQLEVLELAHVAPYLPFETSRGCWWGAKHHCTFCGIDDLVMAFRSKSDDVVLNEILTLSARHKLTDLFAVDSIINFKFYRTLLPLLAHLRDDYGFDLTFFFECKSNLNRDQAWLFRRGGVSAVQPGIESFDDHVLDLMDKGTTAARQVQCLKLLAENDIAASWNLIFQNPFETADDYRAIIDAVPYLHHLPPLYSEGMIPLQINRYAPYHSDPEKYGITNMRPKDYYRLVFPDADIDLSRLAFYFDYDRPGWRTAELDALYQRLETVIDRWRRCYYRDSLVQQRGPGFVRIVDRRVDPDAPEAIPGRETHVILDGVACEIFVACDEVRSEDELIRKFAGRASREDIVATLDRLVDARYVFRSSSRQVINLPLLRERRLPRDAESDALRPAERSRPRGSDLRVLV